MPFRLPNEVLLRVFVLSDWQETATQHRPACGIIDISATALVGEFCIPYQENIARLRCDAPDHTTVISVSYYDHDLNFNERALVSDRLRHLLSTAEKYSHQRVVRFILDTDSQTAIEASANFLSYRPPQLTGLSIEMSNHDPHGYPMPVIQRLYPANHYPVLTSVRLSGIKFPDGIYTGLNDTRFLLVDISNGPQITANILRAFPSLGKLTVSGASPPTWRPDLATTIAIGQVPWEIRLDMSTAVGFLAVNASSFDNVESVLAHAIRMPIQLYPPQAILPFFRAVSRNVFEVMITRTARHARAVEIELQPAGDTDTDDDDHIIPAYRTITLDITKLDQHIWPRIVHASDYGNFTRLALDITLVATMFASVPAAGDGGPRELELIVSPGWGRYVENRPSLQGTVITTIAFALAYWTRRDLMYLTAHEVYVLLQYLFGNVDTRLFDIAAATGEGGDRGKGYSKNTVHALQILRRGLAPSAELPMSFVNLSQGTAYENIEVRPKDRLWERQPHIRESSLAPSLAESLASAQYMLHMRPTLHTAHPSIPHKLYPPATPLYLYMVNDEVQICTWYSQDASLANHSSPVFRSSLSAHMSRHSPGFGAVHMIQPAVTTSPTNSRPEATLQPTATTSVTTPTVAFIGSLAPIPTLMPTEITFHDVETTRYSYNEDTNAFHITNEGPDASLVSKGATNHINAATKLRLMNPWSRPRRGTHRLSKAGPPYPITSLSVSHHRNHPNARQSALLHAQTATKQLAATSGSM
ncbi:hypothetical protein BKA62DRAFT_676555 [Auriculariales sp. MPI-PUGE-AT-0066]|nr:hypothetical protein BKA62DRAFT_676555 [Auriculariales sp. MPI-PUGE-AT-0066]